MVPAARQCKTQASRSPRFLDITMKRWRFLSDECQLFRPPGTRIHTDQIRGSDENYRLGAWDFKAPAAPNISAREHVVDSHHIVSRLLKTRPILFVCAARRLWFPRSLQPPHVVFSAFATVRTAIRRLFYFFLLVKEITFVHSSL